MLLLAPPIDKIKLRSHLDNFLLPRSNHSKCLPIYVDFLKPTGLSHKSAMIIPELSQKSARDQVQKQESERIFCNCKFLKFDAALTNLWKLQT